MHQSIINSVCYTVGWFWCVLLGVKNQSLMSFVGTLFLIFVQLYTTKIKDKSLYVQDLLLAIFSIPMGFFLEFLFIQTNVVHYIHSNHAIPPLWVICLYPLFSLLINHSLEILKKSYLASFIICMITAPLSYIAGASLGAVILPHSLIQTYLVLGTSWGVFVCLLLKISKIIRKAAAETLVESEANNKIRLLYDGECPICKREICVLQKKDRQASVKFIDISSEEFLPKEHGNIDYKTAMSQIHAIDAEGRPLVGIPAFAAVYARCQMLTLSTLMRIPLIKEGFHLFYKLFAKNRLWITGRSTRNLKR